MRERERENSCNSRPMAPNGATRTLASSEVSCERARDSDAALSERGPLSWHQLGLHWHSHGASPKSSAPRWSFCVYARARARVYVCVRVYACVCACVRVFVCVCVCVCARACVRGRGERPAPRAPRSVEYPRSHPRPRSPSSFAFQPVHLGRLRCLPRSNGHQPTPRERALTHAPSTVATPRAFSTVADSRPLSR